MNYAMPAQNFAQEIRNAAENQAPELLAGRKSIGLHAVLILLIFNLLATLLPGKFLHKSQSMSVV